jgi:uncharacterized membrane protein
VKLKDLRQAGLPMLILFSLGALATMAGVLVSYFLLAPQNHGVEKACAVAGMFTGTYIGGSVNLNAVALQYGVTKSGTLFAAINAADNIITTIWIVATLLLPRLLKRVWPRGSGGGAAAEVVDAATLEAKEALRVTDLALLLALGIGTLFLSQLFSQWFPAVPYVLTLTTLALVFAQLPAIHKLRGATVLGYFTVLLFARSSGPIAALPP